MYKCKYFKAHEIVPPKVYNKLGESSFRLFNRGLLKLADLLREEFGSCTINDWKWNSGPNNFSWSGLRTPDSPYYRELSMHSFGAALDLKFSQAPAEVVRQFIRDNIDRILEETGLYSLTIEEDVSWVHVQVDNKSKGLHSFKP